MGHRVAGVGRLTLLLAVLLGAVLIGIPALLLARRFGWRTVADMIPVLVCRGMCGALAVRTRFTGTPHAGARLLAPNHVSWLDIPVLGCREPIAFAAKREVGSWPVLGLLARAQGVIFVDRTRKRSIPATNRQMAAALTQGRSVVLFAEGTTGDGNRLQPFRTSHFEAARLAAAVSPARCLTVQPVSIAYTRRRGLPIGRHDRPRIAWYGDMTLLPHLWGLVTGGPIDCEVHFAPCLPVMADFDRKRIGRQAQGHVRHATALALCGRAAAATEIRPIVSHPVLIAPETA